MDFEQLKHFTSIVKYKTYLEASERLHLSQSSLSKSIIKLEKELQVQLFDRSKRYVTLTKEGETFYEDSMILLEHYKQTMENIRNVHHDRKHLQLCSLPILSQYELYSPIDHFNKNQENYQIHIEELEESQIQEQLSSYSCDFAIIREHSVSSSRYLSKKVAEDELVVALSERLPLANKNVISFDDIKNENFLCLPKHTYIHNLFLLEMNRHNSNPHIILHARMESLLKPLKENKGISLVMKKSLDLYNHPHVITRPLEQPIYSSVLLLYKKEYSKLVKLLF